MDGFEDYLQKANAAQTPEELFNIFVNTLHQYGFDKVLFGLLTNHKDIGLNAGIGILENYPADWMQYYFEHSFDKVDPIVTYGIHQSGAFKWSDISKHVELERKQLKCLNLGAEAGLNNGISIPLRGSNGQAAGISLASSEKKDACYFNPDLVTAFCNHFYVAYKRLHEKNPINPKNIVLTDKEQEILTWAAVGKTDDEIAQILTISKHTINMHFRHIYAKTEANNRVLAVVKGLSFGLITI
ncbi:MAG: LuxR family transcriptional regulator [Alphaproteobacteria bacterium]